MDLDLAAYAARAHGLETFRAAADRQLAENQTAFVLYSGREVRNWAPGVPGDIIATREFRLGNYRKNPVVLADHDPSQVIGRGTASIVSDGEVTRLEGVATWDVVESNPLAVLIAGQHARGVRSAVSIGFQPGKGTMGRDQLQPDDPLYVDPAKLDGYGRWAVGRYIRAPELYEWSSVSVPKDPSALQLQSWALEAEDPDERIRRMADEIVSARWRDVVLQAVRQDAELRAAITATVFAALPPDFAAPAATNPPADESDWYQEW